MRYREITLVNVVDGTAELQQDRPTAALGGGPLRDRTITSIPRSYRVALADTVGAAAEFPKVEDE